MGVSGSGAGSSCFSFSSAFGASAGGATTAVRRRLADLQPGALELARELLDFLIVELELGREGLESGRDR